MANGVKEYKIVINGVKESINAVDSLNKQLDDLEKRMNALNSKGVNVSTPKGGDSYKGELDAQDKLERDILATEEKLAQVRDENYKKLLHMKEELKEYTQIAKSQVAGEANQQGLFDTNTMFGMKGQLKSIKAEMQTLDVSSDRFKELTQQANELNNKLKEIEQGYGQYGRNVGNYANGVAEGITKVKIQVGDTVREFSNAREASRTLGNELKSMSINGEQGTKAFKDMQKAVAQLNSDIKDATVSSRGMDNLLDTMQSFAALGQVGQGLSALFGFDDEEIERSIQKLVALQNVMQGIETINQQINSQEGIGGWLAKGNSMIDDFVSKLTGANKAQEALNATTTAGVTASKSLAAAEEAQAVATNTATVATKALSFALKTIGIGLVIAAVAALIEYWEDIYNWFVDTIPALKNLGAWFEKIEKIAVGVGNAILNYMVQPLATLVKVIKSTIEGNFSDIPKIISDGMKKTFNIAANFQAGYNKAAENQQRRHNSKMLKEQREANEEWLKDEEAKYGKSYKTTKQYLDKQMALIDKQIANERKGSKKYNQLIKERKELQRKIWENERTERERQQKKTQRSDKQHQQATVDGVKELYELQIAAMKEGLNKTLKQLEEERRQKLQKIRQDGVMVGQLTEATNALYDKKIEDAKKKHSDEMEKITKEMYSTMLNIQKDNADKQLKLSESTYEKELDNLEDYQRQIYNLRNTSYGVQGAEHLSPGTRSSLGLGYLNVSPQELQALKEYRKLDEDISNFDGDNSTLLGMIEKSGDMLDEALEKYPDFLQRLREFDINYTGDLNETYRRRITAFNDYWKKRRDIALTNLTKITDDEKAAENARYKAEKDSEDKRYNEAYKQVEKKMELAKDEAMATIENEKELNDALELIDKEYDADWRKVFKEQKTTLETIEKQHNENLEKIDRDYYKEARKENAEYYAELMQNLRDYQTAIYSLEGKTEVKDSWGFINIKKTRENNQKLLDSYENMADAVTKRRKQLNKDFFSGLIDKETYEATQRELDTFVVDLGEKMDAVKANMEFGAYFTKMAQQINEYVQYLGSQLTSLMNTIWDYQDAAYEKQMEELEKHIDEYEELLQKQEEITEQHKNKVESIEDELATSRGDRRQHLIDQLNEEIAAQRRSAAEEKKIEREKKKKEAQKEKEEEAQRKREHQRQVTQAFISWHLSIANALSTQPFMPVGLAMGALATALGAVQYALVKNSKYADGGVIQGKSHKDGGVPVLGGRAEVEGNEFITNKVTTQKNTDLLYYINSKKRKLDINDFIEFYSGKGGKKAITQMSPRGKFADGGVMSPVLDDSVKVDNRILNALEHYAERPYYVTVTDIENKMDDVNYVRTLAGVEQ